MSACVACDADGCTPGELPELEVRMGSAGLWCSVRTIRCPATPAVIVPLDGMAVCLDVERPGFPDVILVGNAGRRQPQSVFVTRRPDFCDALVQVNGLPMVTLRFTEEWWIAAMSGP